MADTNRLTPFRQKGFHGRLAPGVFGAAQAVGGVLLVHNSTARTSQTDSVIRPSFAWRAVYLAGAAFLGESARQT
jgi:hypothetical protein